MTPTLERLLSTALLLLVAGVCLVRGIGLVRDPDRLEAHEERVWMHWAHPRSDTPAIFARVAALLRPDETICLQVARNLGEVDRLRYMANYYLLDQRVAAVRLRGARRSFPAQATVVTIDWQGEARVERAGGVGGAGGDRGVGDADGAGGDH
jgi:hypothetical protein